MFIERSYTKNLSSVIMKEALKRVSCCSVHARLGVLVKAITNVDLTTS